ncbi:ATP-binding protein [Flexithrix dorotheae]|uniref:ATP-binding protein n=1 Tax=Flexithrix dorotheae TaxID=70993 RepID=UPI00036B9B19|nr:ATP-binding protein [Flexithrix dorotheae]
MRNIEPEKTEVNTDLVLYCNFLPTGEIKAVNETFASYLQLTEKELINQPLHNFIHSESYQTIIGFTESISESQFFQAGHSAVPLFQKDSSTFKLFVQGNFHKKKLKGFSLFAFPQKEEIKVKKEGILEKILNEGNTEIWFWDFNKNGQNSYDSFYKISGFQHQNFDKEAFGWVDNIYQKDKANVLESLSKFQKEKAEGKILECIFRKINPKGKIYWVISRAMIFSTDNGEPSGIIGVDTDITRFKESEETLLRVKKETEDSMREKEEFFSIMTHEIRTPMNAVIGMTHLLLQNHPREDQKNFLNSLKFSADNLLALINDILDYNKIQAGKLDFENCNFDLHDLLWSIRMSHKPLATDKALKIRLFIDDEVPKLVCGDFTRLSQILNNLLSNAVKFTSVGSVDINVEQVTQNEVNTDLVFEIKDSGIGIAEDKRKKIFEPFQQGEKNTTRNFGGTGLGLSIVKNLVELQGGRIELQSKLGKGTTFKIYLRFDKVAEDQKINKVESNIHGLNIGPKKELHGARILYVEDVIPNQILMEGFSANWGIKLDLASDGFEAIHKIQQNDYDLVLMDIQMPEIDGYETTERIRAIEDEFYKNIPIIALTAELSKNTKEKVVTSGMNDFVLKPINPDKLYELLKSYFSTQKKKGIKKRPAKESSKVVKNNFLTIDFSEADKLFGNNAETYLQFIKMTQNDFNDSKGKLIEAVRYNNYDLFRRVHHKLAGVLILLKLSHFNNHLISIKEEVRANKFNEKSRKERIDSIFVFFENADLLLNQKMKEVVNV